jgi:hypothetical protein
MGGFGGSFGSRGGDGGNGQGGGIYAASGGVTLNNSTLANDRVSGGSGGSGYNARGADGNGQGGGLFQLLGTATLNNTIIAGNSATLDANIHGSWSGSNDLTSGDPMLAALGDYGGPTPTMALLAGSPALDAGSNALVPAGLTTDQRGFARISGAAVDIGAYEVQEPILSPATLPDGTYSAVYSQTITATETGGAGGPYTFAVTAGSLPTGLNLDGTAGTLSGTPASNGVYTFTVTATDSAGFTASQSYTLTIDKAALTITASSTSKTYGETLTFAGTEFSASGLVNGDTVSGVTLTSAGAAADNAQVAAYFQTLFSLGGNQVQAQVLAMALNVYATTSSLGGTAGKAYGFTVSDTGLGARSFSVGKDGSAFGVVNNTTMNVYALLAAVNKNAVKGSLYNGSAALQAQCADLFSSLDAAGGIA